VTTSEPRAQKPAERRPFYFSPLFLITVVVALLLVVVFFDVIWNEFIFRHFWGSVEADARDRDYEGVSEGYNPVNTISYGIIVAFSVYGIFRYFSRIELKTDGLFIAAILPFVVVGSVTRSLEDAKLFEIPLSYIFISPLIYIVLGVLVLVLIFYFDLVERWLERQEATVKEEKHGIPEGVGKEGGGAGGYTSCRFLTVPNAIHKKLTVLVSLPLLVLMPLYLVLLMMNSAVFVLYLNSAAIIILTAVFILVAAWLLEKKGFALSLGLGFVGLYIMSFFILYVIHFVWFDRWYDGGAAVKLWVMPAIIGLTFVATLAVYLLALVVEKKEPSESKADNKGALIHAKLTLLAFLHPLNLAVLFAHFLDAAATFVGIDYFSYSEKHVLPSFLIDVTGTAAVMFPLKFLIVVLIVYMIDVYYKKELEESGFENFQGLLKLAIIVLGLAPGMRDMLRLAMGV